jgi:S-adenosylmethionine hydrolase
MTRSNPVIALLTDFGLRDHYVGVMKAVMVSACPGVRIVDISHEVEPQNVSQAAYLLWASYQHFPTGTVFVTVVDPGVGGNRDILGVRSDRHLFLAPGNGSLDMVIWEEGIKEVTVINQDNVATRRILPATISSTFHGRDLLAPLASGLVNGTNLDALGAKRRVNWVQSPFVEGGKSETQAKVLHVDRFGNVVTNICSSLPEVRNHSITIRVGKRLVHTWAENYESISPGKVSMVVGSSRLVEIVMNQRSAASFLELEQNDILGLRS